MVWGVLGETSFLVEGVQRRRRPLFLDIFMGTQMLASQQLLRHHVEKNVGLQWYRCPKMLMLAWDSLHLGGFCNPVKILCYYNKPFLYGYSFVCLFEVQFHASP